MRAVIPIVVEAADEWHISSLVVHTSPSHVDDVVRQVAAIAGAEVHASTPQGKVIVTLEGPTSRSILDAINAIQAIQGVITATLVYQCADTLDSMNEELPNVHCP